MRNGLSAYDRDNLAMFKKMGSSKQEIAEHTARLKQINAQEAANISGVKLTKTGNGRYNVTWNDSSTSNGFGGSISFSATASKAKTMVNTLKQTGSSRKAMFALNH